ncbi:MAG TPA: IS200/IS605 family element RNA-guided endonuclease TnpB [Ktedonobacteraceae bacterium]|nr:IS200/IS605 family element RNA-guided endonuclease TnpB [Ktedonobacteraceae bacterium]
MKQKRAYKYRFYPKEEQAHNLAQTFGCVRFVYNWALNKRKRAYFDEGIKLFTKDLSAALTELKKAEGTKWLSDVSAVPLQQALRHLDTAYKNFFSKQAKYPTFKKKHHQQSATYTDNAFALKDGYLTLAKQQEPLHIVWSRPLPKNTKASSVTVSKDQAGRYFVSILVEEEIEHLEPVERAVGIDVGLKSFVVLSTGESIANPRYYARSEKQLARAQRELAKKRKGSKNRKKARLKVARLHAKIADQRRDYQHQLSTKLISENQTVCVETLMVKNLLKNRKLAKAIADVGWSEFLRQLEYKAKWYDRQFIKIDRWYPSSKTCSACGSVLETLTLGVREWICEACGVCHDRDVNAAFNILAAGLVASACGEDVRQVDLKGQRAILDETGILVREGGNPLPF